MGIGPVTTRLEPSQLISLYAPFKFHFTINNFYNHAPGTFYNYDQHGFTGDIYVTVTASRALRKILFHDNGQHYKS